MIESAEVTHPVPDHQPGTGQIVPTDIPLALLLREAALEPEFKLVRSFVISGEGIERVDIYRVELELKNVEEVDLPFPNHPEATRIRVRPITE